MRGLMVSSAGNAATLGPLGMSRSNRSSADGVAYTFCTGTIPSFDEPLHIDELVWKRSSSSECGTAMGRPTRLISCEQ